jgi:hypothetical protein
MLSKRIKVLAMTVLAAWVLCNPTIQDDRYAPTAASLAAEKGSGEALKAGKKHWIGNDYYFIYSFDKKPQLGTVILKIELFAENGQKERSLEITGNADMPSMKGAHSSGHKPFKMNKKGDYLLPVNVVMPGDWEVELNFLEDKKVIYTGSVRFRV